MFRKKKTKVPDEEITPIMNESLVVEEEVPPQQEIQVIVNPELEPEHQLVTEEKPADNPDVYDRAGGVDDQSKAWVERYGTASGKAIDFQIRVKIIQARQLVGGNIEPVVRVEMKRQMKQTHIKKSTTNPWWNESFFFNFHLPASEILDEIVIFSVFNSRKLRADALLGSFKCDLRMMYKEPGHAFINKWILLSDPDDATLSAKGYLKISACILGPGDVAPEMVAKENNEEEDIERNLLKPVGVSLRPATFSLYLYKAEDLPANCSGFQSKMIKVFQMSNTCNKDLPNPYFVFSFAGKEVKSKIIEGSDCPEWNQVLRMGLHFPSMCERIKLEIRDKNRIGADNIICTKYLSLSLLSSLGKNGFLPTFGPCFVNMYGSTQDFDTTHDAEDLNQAKVECINYQGRALMHLITTLGAMPENPVEDLFQEERCHISRYMRTRKYRVHAAFYTAQLISANLSDAPIQFEVSIGNYGNSLEENVTPCTSTTPPANAVFDGCYYYFLPWSSIKPCVVVDCSWEDISFRLESLNMILNIHDRLKTSLKQLQVGMKARRPVSELAQIFVSMLNKLINDCDTALSPPAASHPANELDTMKEKARKMTLSQMKAAAIILRDTATNLTDAVGKIEEFLHCISNLTDESQNSVPNVMIWMISKEKRIAYFHIPAYEVLHSENDEMKGRNCGRMMSIQLKYPFVKDKKRKLELPVVLTVKLWFGLQTESHAWHQMQDGELSVCAETYENQVSILGSWCDKGPGMSRPKWSDMDGNVKLNKSDFFPPHGWQWDGDWFINPEVGMLFDNDSRYTKCVVEVHECSSRALPGELWGPSPKPWIDMKEEASPEIHDIPLPDGWKWDDDWQIDLNRAVDEGGWEYSAEASTVGFAPVEKTFLLYRRRRWLRTRKIIEASKRKNKEDEHTLEKQGWEYSPMFSRKFCSERKSMDMVRRRRWHRKMISLGNEDSYFLRVYRKNEDEEEEEDEEEPLVIEEPTIAIAAQQESAVKQDVFVQLEVSVSQEPVVQQETVVIQKPTVKKKPDDITSNLAAPRIFITFRNPFVRVAFATHCMITETQKNTLSPTWNQTLIFDNVKFYTDPEVIEDAPPLVYIELFDYDNFGKPEFLGRTKVHPMVKLNSTDPRTPVLHWHSIKRLDQDGGEILAAFELLMVTDSPMPFLPPKIDDLYVVPAGIKPVMQSTGIEILCWGVRNMKKFQLSAVSSPSVRFECGGKVQDSSIIKDTKKNPNFSDQQLFFEVMLPKEALYMPPINIIVRDHRHFGNTPTIGVNSIMSVDELTVDPLTMEIEPGPSMSSDQFADLPPVVIPSKGAAPPVAEVDTKEKESALSQQELDWWSKYYASVGDTDKCRKYSLLQYDTLEILAGELENSNNYKAFSDFCQTLPLYRGKQKQEDDESNIIGEFKGSFCRYPLPADPNEPRPPRVFQNLPSGKPEECIIRVYVIKGSDLQPCDPNGLADPYLEIELGKQKITTREEYVPNSINPNFGRMFELKALIPIYKDLVIRVKDFDLLSFDDTVGETIIDLENRCLTKYRATCGLPKTYCESGINKWRDSVKPVDILLNYCKRNRLEKPEFINKNTVNIGNRQYTLSNFETNMRPSKHWGPENQRLALHVLNLTSLVKEHVEARPLYYELQPGIEQGKLHMWVDIFPKSIGPPGLPFDITPRTPAKYFLCCIIWNTTDVILDDVSLTGEKMSDIYVQGWMDGIDEKQKTDVHYRSLNGEGNFNWRFVIPFEYILSEQVMVVTKKEHLWSLDTTETRKPPKFTVQIWDNDKFFSDDFLGQLELNLNAMPLPVRTSKRCNLRMLPEVGRSVKLASLFEMKHSRGFWPCYNNSTGVRQLTGKVEMELQLLSAEEFSRTPSGVGRDHPNLHPKLDPPKRPETSFLWFTSPFKVVKYVIWFNYRHYVFKAIIISSLMFLFTMFIYTLPGSFSFWIFNSS